MKFLKDILDFLKVIGESFGFTGLVAVLFAFGVFWQSRYMVKKMENLYKSEIDRIAEERNKLQEYILDGKHLTTKSSKKSKGEKNDS